MPRGRSSTSSSRRGTSSAARDPRPAGADRPAPAARLSSVAPRARATQATGATLIGREALGPSLSRLTLRPDDGALGFEAGQYVQVRMADPAAPARPYSIASAPGGRDLDLVVSFVEGGALSPRLLALPLGSRLTLGKPTGLFRLEGYDERTHLLIGTGSGIAPLLSMVAVLRARPRPPRTLLFHGVRSGAELAGRRDFEQLDGTWFSYRPTLSRSAVDVPWQGRTGRVDAHVRELIAVGSLEPADTVAYLCGNPAMIEDCRALLVEAGLPAAAIRAERFTPQDADRPAADGRQPASRHRDRPARRSAVPTPVARRWHP